MYKFDLKCLRGFVTLKYIRVAGEYRFTTSLHYHADLVPPGEKASSAGFVSVDADMSPPWVKVGSAPSLGLNIYPAAEDEALIRTLVVEALEE